MKLPKFCWAVHLQTPIDPMRSKLTILCFVLALPTQVAIADTLNDCKTDVSRPEARVRACTAIIASADFGPNEKAEAYVSRGNARTDAGAIRLALTDFTESIRIKNDNVWAFAGRGRTKLVAGNRIGAIEDYNKALQLSPSSAELHVERGHVYLVSGKLDEAISDFTEALRSDPENANAFNERGVAYFRKGDLVRAQEDFTRAIAELPFPDFYANRGQLFEAQGNPTEAVAEYRTALLGDPSLVQARQALDRLGAIEEISKQTDQRVREGEALAEKNCSKCHAIGLRGFSPNKDAPEFRNLNRRHPFYWLRAPVTRAIFATHQQMPHFDLSAGEVDTVIAYMNSLSSRR